MKKLGFGFVIAILLIYGFGVVMFSGRFQFRTTIGSVDACFKTPGEVSLELMQKTEREAITFILKDGSTETVTFKELGIFRTNETDVSSFMKSSLLWPLSLFSKTKYEIDSGMSYAENTLSIALESLDFVRNGTIVSEDACLVFTDDGTYEIQPEVYGNQIDMDKLFDAVMAAMAEEDFVIDLSESGVYILPEVYADDDALVVTAEQANAYLSMEITLDFGAGETVMLYGENLYDIIVVDGNQVSVSAKAVADYVSNLASEYNTKGTERTFVTQTGENITMQPDDTTVCGFEGWLMDKDVLVSTLISVLEAGEDTEVTVPWTRKGAAHGDENDFGDTYLEISIENQHMWLVEDGVVTADTDVVTGGSGNDTPTGVWWTTDLYTEHMMTGSYGTAFCHYFIRVTIDGVGVHDATWRSSFGGTIYETDGSHGCINTPYSVMKTIFERVSSYDTILIIIW